MKLIDILKEIQSTPTLRLVALFTDKNDLTWKKDDWSFDPLFKTQGLIAKYGKGANGQSWGKPSILCTDYNGDPFSGFHDGWKWAVVFEKDINGVYLDDEIFYYGKYPSKEQEELAIEYINDKPNISLGVLNSKFNAIITQNDFPYGNYVLTIKPNEITQIIKRTND